MKLRRIAALLMAAMLICALAGCGDKGDNGDSGAASKTIKVWASQDDQALTRSLADRFIEANPQYKVTIELGVVGEPDAWARYSEDPAAAADVFFFPNDQLRDFVGAGGLYEVTRNKANITSRNMQSSVDAATLDGKLWAYPVSADNGYFLYYDKSVFTEEDVQSLDRLLEVAAAAGKGFQMDIDANGWYVASFFLGAGCTLSIGPDGRQISDFNNANGLAAAEAMRALASHPAYISGNDDVLKGGMGGSVAAGISGTWIAGDMAAILGDNYGATKLPTFTMNGRQVQMGSFGGYKMVGINATIDDPEKLVIAMDFADFLTNEENQVERFEVRAIGPSNINAAAAPAVQENIALAALAAQSGYATSQNDVLSNYWTPAGAFGSAMANRDTSDLQTLLDNMVAQIQT